MNQHSRSSLVAASFSFLHHSNLLILQGLIEFYVIPYSNNSDPYFEKSRHCSLTGSFSLMSILIAMPKHPRAARNDGAGGQQERASLALAATK